MRIHAAIDLRGGAVVQLVGGDPGAERVRLADPAAVARRWIDAGFRHLHVVDLDAALGHGANADRVAAIAASCAGRASLQVGGGLRDEDAVARALELGADRVVVGTRGVEDRAWLETVAAASPGRVVVAADVREGAVVTRGWTASTGLRAAAFLSGLVGLPLAGVLVTDVGREGREAGIDATLFREVVRASPHPVTAAGGITTPADLDALAGAGVAGAVLGMALYTGRLDPVDALAREDGER